MKNGSVNYIEFEREGDIGGGGSLLSNTGKELVRWQVESFVSGSLPRTLTVSI